MLCLLWHAWTGPLHRPRNGRTPRVPCVMGRSCARLCDPSRRVTRTIVDTRARSPARMTLARTSTCAHAQTHTRVRARVLLCLNRWLCAPSGWSEWVRTWSHCRLRDTGQQLPMNMHVACNIHVVQWTCTMQYSTRSISMQTRNDIAQASSCLSICSSPPSSSRATRGAKARAIGTVRRAHAADTGRLLLQGGWSTRATSCAAARAVLIRSTARARSAAPSALRALCTSE
jgi:hypothetical protein